MYQIAFLFSSILLSGSEVHASKLNVEYTPLKIEHTADSVAKLYAKAMDIRVRKENYSNRKVNLEVINSIDFLKEVVAEYAQDGFMMQNDSMSLVCQNILEKIKHSNPLLANRITYLFTLRRSEPNATCYGNGLLMINYGIFEWMKTEGELAFIISHEISHDYLDHVWTGVMRTAKIIHDKEFKEKIRTALRSTYGSNTKVDSIIRTYMSKLMNGKRDYEYAADSLGLVFYLNAGYPLSDAINAMRKMDVMDDYYFTEYINFEKFFSFSNLEFDPSWIDFSDKNDTWKRTSTLFHYPDSLKTHPNCRNRIDRIFSFYPDLQVDTSLAVRDVYSLSRCKNVHLEMTRIYIDEGYPVNALYQSLQLLKLFPDEKYLYASTTESLCLIAWAMINHKLSEILDFQDDLFVPSYNELLGFIHEMNSGIIKKFTDGYFDNYLTYFPENEYYDYVKVLYISLKATKPEQIHLYNEFKAKYKKSQYTNSIFEVLKIKL